MSLQAFIGHSVVDLSPSLVFALVLPAVDLSSRMTTTTARRKLLFREVIRFQKRPPPQRGLSFAVRSYHSALLAQTTQWNERGEGVLLRFLRYTVRVRVHVCAC